MNESWLPVIGFEGMYEVSDLGRVRSVTRLVPCSPNGSRNRTVVGKILSTPVGSSGYPQITLGQVSTRTVHGLVAEAFIGPRPAGYEICHSNGDRSDKRLVNLRYDTVSENHLDTVRHGRNVHSLKTHCKQGHPFDESNTQINALGHRRCRACGREQERRRRIRERAA